MAGKFMKIRKILLPALTVVVIASQLCGCAASTKKETSDILSSTDSGIEFVIEVPEPDFEVQGAYEMLDWVELGKLTDCAEIRETVDTYFGNYTDEASSMKYGPFYIDTTGAQCTNNTLKVVLGNRYVAEMFATGGTVDIEKLDPTNLGAIEVSEETTEDGTSAMESAFNNSLDATYTDLSDSDRTPALINAYFNLLPDSTPNYFNGGDTLSRAEAMALVTRATTPVMTLTAVDGFADAVTGTDYDQYINYAAQQNDNAYINTSDKSLTPDNFKGAMSRAEFIYLVMNDVYTTEAVQAFDTTNTAIKDCINAGDLSAELKISDADHCNSQTLSHSLKNVDKGVCTALYNSLAMAVDKGIITPETRWNEGITKAEAIEIVFNAFSAYYEENGYLVNNADKGSLQALEEQALELWNKQDKNDMNCTEEEFIADYIQAIDSGAYTPEQFEELIENKYSIEAAEEFAEKEEQIYIDSLWQCYGGEENVSCDKETFAEEYKAYAEEKGDSYVESEFGAFIQDKYPVEAETEAPTESTGTGSGGNTYTPPAQTEPAQTEPVYTPPTQTEPVQTTPQAPVTPPADTGNNDSGSNDTPDYDAPVGGDNDSDLGGRQPYNPDNGWIEGAN